MVGIVAYGAYVPRLRLNRQAVYDANKWFAAGLRGLAKGERSMANWDEDSITMAVEASRDCLTSHDATDVRSLYFASTTHPFKDRQNAGVIGTALSIEQNLLASDVGGSQKAGTSALIAGLNASKNGGGPALVAAADKRMTRVASSNELNYGDGAAALLCGTENIIAKLIGHHSVSMDFVDHFRGNHRSAPRVSGEQSVFANRIDQARKTVGVPENRARGWLGKKGNFGRYSTNLQTPLDVSPRLFQVERLKVAAQCDALLDLPEFERVQHFVQLRLTGKHDLQQLLLRGFQIRQEANLLQQFGRQMMRFVHHQQRGQFTLMPLHQERTQGKNKFIFGFARHRQPEIAGNVADKFQCRQARIEHIGKGDSGAPQKFQNAPHQHGLARADFAGQNDKPFARPYPIVERS